MRFILLNSLSNDALENGAHKHISIINVVGFQKQCSSPRGRILLQNSNGFNVRSIKVLVCIMKDSKETAKAIIFSVTFHDIYIFISIKTHYQCSLLKRIMGCCIRIMCNIWPNIAIQYITYVKNYLVTVIWGDVNGGFLKIGIKITITLLKTRHNSFNDLYNMIFYKAFFSRVKLYFLVLVHRFKNPAYVFQLPTVKLVLRKLFDSISSVTSLFVGSWKT